MLTCKEASLLASKKLDKTLSITEHFKFSLHLILCVMCRHYAKEIETLHKVIQIAGKIETNLLVGNDRLSEQARERIKQKMDKVLHS